MNESPLNVLCVLGLSSNGSATRAVMSEIAGRLRLLGSEVDIFDPRSEPLELFDPEISYTSRTFLRLKTRVENADAYVLGTPDYHGSVSSTLKNFLDHFWQEFTGKLFAQVVVSPEKGLTVIDQLRTVARQCYAWSLPYGVSFAANTDLRDGKVVPESVRNRIEMLVHDIQVYGVLLRHQRRVDLVGSTPGFLARLRTAS